MGGIGLPALFANAFSVNGDHTIGTLGLIAALLCSLCGKCPEKQSFFYTRRLSIIAAMPQLLSLP